MRDKSQRPFCGLLMLLVVSGCGGGGGTAPPPKPLTATAETLYSFGAVLPMQWDQVGCYFRAATGTSTLRRLLADSPSSPTTTAATEPPPPTLSTSAANRVFKITPTGEETVLHLFAAAPADGNFPEILIQGNDSNFYGTTYEGGAYDLGTVFKLTPGGVETILYSFKEGLTVPTGKD